MSQAGSGPTKGHSDSNLCQLIGSFITFINLVTQHQYQLNSVMFSQFQEGLLAVLNQL
jgi:hypothetical protein